MSIAWDSPDGHTWAADLVHVPDGMTRYLEALQPELDARGFQPMFERLGSPLAGLHATSINRRLFQRPALIGAPDTPPKPGATPKDPPRLVLRLLFALHPELRRRARTAARVFVEKPWRADRAQWWTTLRPRWTDDLLRLGSIDLASLDDEALAGHVDACTRAFVDGFSQHLRLITDPAAVGDWLLLTERTTGVGAVDALAALRAATDQRMMAMDGLPDVAAALRADDDARTLLADASVPAAERLERLVRRDGQVGTTLQGWLALHGKRIIEACDVSGATLEELPDVVVGILQACVAARAEGPVLDDAPLRAIREQVPANEQGAWAAALAEAQAAYGLHDETARLLVCWPAGLARLALLEVGRRLVSQGRLHDAVHMVEARPDQVAPLLHGSADAPTADELRAEYLQRTDLAGLDTPPYVGPPPVPAPYHLMPDAVRRVGTAVEAYLALADARVTRPVEGAPGRTQEAVERVSGLPVNAGIYEGRACLVTGPGDFGRLRQGDVLVARVTSPAYDVVLPLLGAAVTDRGGVLCHTAIVAREFGIPAVVGCGDATRRIPHGARVRVDGATGEVVILG